MFIAGADVLSCYKSNRLRFLYKKSEPLRIYLLTYVENEFKEMCCIQIRKDKNAKNTIHRISKVLQCNKCIRTINDSD